MYHQASTPVLRKHLLQELYGYFELFQALSHHDSYFKTNTLFSANSLATGFRETLSLLVKTRSQMDIESIKNFIRIIYDFIKVHKTETDYHLILYETTIKIYRLEHLLRLKMVSFNRTDTKVMKELQKIVVLRKGLTEVIIRSYLGTHFKLTTVEKKDLKDQTAEFLKRVILELQEEESVLLQETQGPSLNEYYHELGMVNSSPTNPEISTIYRYLMRLVFEVCSQKQEKDLFCQVFKLITLKDPISKLITFYATYTQEPLKRYYLEMFKFLGVTAANSNSAEVVYIITSQICQTLINPTAKQQWKEVTAACQTILNSVYDAGHSNPSFMLMVYSVLVKDYIKTRIDNQPLYSYWFDVHRFLMPWVAKLHRFILRRPHLNAELEKISDVKMQFWMFTMFDIEDYLKLSKIEVEEFSLAFNVLREPSERIYSNSFLRCDLILQQPVAYEVEPKLKRALKTFYPDYEK